MCYKVFLPSESEITMALPGSQGHPAPKNEVEAMSQLIQLVFQLQFQLTHVASELRNINNNLQHINQRIPNR